jgi:hypothetical protein
MRQTFSVLALLGAVILTGCGAPAAPAPPSLNLPNPAQNLSAARIGNSVHLVWTMPTRTTDRVLLKRPIPVEVCRAVETGPCAPIARLAVAPGSSGQYTDELPADLTRGPDRLLRYEIALRNHAGKSAGPSNSAYSAAGASPALLTGLTVQMRSNGALLSWQPVAQPGPVSFRIERLQLNAPKETERPKSPLEPPKPAAAQTLQVQVAEGGLDPGHAIDASALFSQRYRYVVERFVPLTLSGQTVEVQGLPSEPVEVTTTDTFPPAVPQGLVAVADSAAAAIDLSWSPDSDSDLAAYYVYRRDVGQNEPVRRIASVGLETSYRDSSVQLGHTYAYSLSAVDQSGNESQKCAAVEETLPNQ